MLAELQQTVEQSEAGNRLYLTDALQPIWLAAYTYPRHEKRVAAQLEGKGVECYLPLYQSKRDWKQRRVLLELPLFPSYIFVRVPVRERLRVLETPSIAYIVSCKGVPVPLHDDEVKQIRECLSRKLTVEPCEYLKSGMRVRINGGPLCGLQGVIVRRNGRMRFVLSVDLIQRSVAISVEAADVEAVEPLRAQRK